MKLAKTMLTAAALTAAASLAGAASHAELLKTVSTYKPAAGFNRVIGAERFVGYFLAGPERCDVTVFQAQAADESLVVPAKRLVLQIAAGGRSELEAGPDSALAIACTADADAIKVATQTGRIRAAGL